MTECTQTALQFPGFSRRKIVSFNGDITSNGGVQLLRLAERTGLIKAAHGPLGILADKELHPRSSRWSDSGSMAFPWAMRDHDCAPGSADGAFPDESLASPSTLCRLENRANRNTAVALHKVLIDNFIASYKQAPRRLILDVDATDDRVHGDQEGRFFHGYYDHYCFLPLYVFCGDQLWVSYLRSSDRRRKTQLGDLLDQTVAPGVAEGRDPGARRFRLLPLADGAGSIATAITSLVSRKTRVCTINR